MRTGSPVYVARAEKPEQTRLLLETSLQEWKRSLSECPRHNPDHGWICASKHESWERKCCTARGRQNPKHRSLHTLHSRLPFQVRIVCVGDRGWDVEHSAASRRAAEACAGRGQRFKRRRRVVCAAQGCFGCSCQANQAARTSAAPTKAAFALDRFKKASWGQPRCTPS